MDILGNKRKRNKKNSTERTRSHVTSAFVWDREEQQRLDHHQQEDQGQQSLQQLVLQRLRQLGTRSNLKSADTTVGSSSAGGTGATVSTATGAAETEAYGEQWSSKVCCCLEEGAATTIGSSLAGGTGATVSKATGVVATEVAEREPEVAR